MNSLGSDVAALLHEASPVVPEAVVESQLVLQLLWLLHARVRVLPFKRGQPERKSDFIWGKVIQVEPCKEEHGDGDAEVGGRHVDPHVQRERLE